MRALVGVAFMVALGFGLVAPALPLFAREFGVGKAAAGAVVSAFAVMRLVMAPFVGRLVNAFGERVLLATGIGVVAVSSALAGLAQTYWQLLVLRGLGGIGSIMFSVSAASLLVRVTPSHLRGRAQGVWAGAFLIGLIAGPAVGTIATFSLRAPFFLYAGTLVVAGLIGLSALRHSELAARQQARSAPLELTIALRDRAYLAALAASFAGDFALVGARSSIVPQFVGDRLGLELGLGLRRIPRRQRGQRGAPAAVRAGSPTPSGAGRCSSSGCWSVRSGSCVLPLAPAAGGLMVAAALLGVAGAADSVAPGAIMGDVVGRARRHGGGGVPDVGRPRRGAGPGRRGLGGRRRGLRRGVRAQRPGLRAAGAGGRARPGDVAPAGAGRPPHRGRRRRLSAD